MSFGLTIQDLKAGRRPTAQQSAAALSRITGGEPEVNKDIPVNITLNGKKLTTGVMDDAVTYAPVRAIAEALGAKVTYNASSKTVNIVKE